MQPLTKPIRVRARIDGVLSQYLAINSGKASVRLLVILNGARIISLALCILVLPIITGISSAQTEVEEELLYPLFRVVIIGKIYNLEITDEHYCFDAVIIFSGPFISIMAKDYKVIVDEFKGIITPRIIFGTTLIS